ncbi:MAG: C39 family peptidase [Tannerellaceae bacterium]|jgi:hypothetical protein|nr:C39 family peptidase [Tannerellaceae bacterium]
MKKKTFHLLLILILAAACTKKPEKNGVTYYPSPDFYTMHSTPTLTLLEHFKTFQQTTDVTCGPSCALMVLDHFGKRNGYDEMSLKALRGTDQDTTYLKHLVTIFDAIGGFNNVSTYDFADPKEISEHIFLDYLKMGIPVIIGTNEWGGHWQVVIGYDTMGTKTTKDDVLIIADPYDRTDHNQDGYSICSFQKLYHGSWENQYDPDYDWGLFIAVWPKE